MISEKVQVLIASFFEMYKEIALHTFFFFFVIHAVAFLGFKVKMLRQFCKTGCSSKFSSLHKEFRACSCTVTALVCQPQNFKHLFWSDAITELL